MSHPYKSQVDASRQAKARAFQDGGSLRPEDLHGYREKWPGEMRLWRPGGPVDRSFRGALADIGRQLKEKEPQSEANWHEDNPKREALREPGDSKMEIDPDARDEDLKFGEEANKGGRVKK